jgi:hypothetical protein
VKRQYLGDSKDSFKWDYHDYLVSELKYPRLTVALMLTPDDAGNDGKTKAERFPARTPILRFCREFQSNRTIERIKALPRNTGGAYEVTLHKDGRRLTDRTEYFSGFDSNLKQLVFLDPDNGFEPEKSCNDKHVSYKDIAILLEQLSDTSIVSVFHHFRRVSFPDDFARIRARLGTMCYSTAIYWHSLMFVAVGKSERSIDAVIAANKRYAADHPVKVIG